MDAQRTVRSASQVSRPPSTGALATGAALIVSSLYVIGAIRTAGQLHATGLSITDTFQLVPDRRHLVTGAGIVLSLETFAVVLMIGLIYVLARIPVPESSGDKRPTTWRDRVALAGPTLGLFTLTLVGPWWSGPGLVFTFGCVFLVIWADTRYNGSRLGRVPGRRYVAGIVVASLVFAFVSAYWAASPLSQATVRTDRDVLVGPYIAKDADFVYLAAPGGRHRAIPLDDVQSLELEPQHRPESPSVLQLLGVVPR